MSDETPPSDENAKSEPVPTPDDTAANSYVELHGEVDKHFKGSWEQFLKAVQNPADILYFVLWRHCGGDKDKFEAWGKEKKLPEDWLPRFYGMLTEEGQFSEDARGGRDLRDAEPGDAAQAGAAQAGDADTVDEGGSINAGDKADSGSSES